MTTADVATAIEETVGLRPGSVSAAEARSIFDLEVCSLEVKKPGNHEIIKQSELILNIQKHLRSLNLRTSCSELTGFQSTNINYGS